MDKLPHKPASTTHVKSKSSLHSKSNIPTTLPHPPVSASKRLANKTTPFPEATRMTPCEFAGNGTRLKNLEENNPQKLKSPYLSCLLEMLKMDGNSKLEVTTQNKIMNNFQVITGMNCESYARLNRELTTNQMQRNGSSKCSCNATSSEKKESISQKRANDNFKKIATASKPVTLVKSKPIKNKSLNCNKVQKVEDKAPTEKVAESKGMISIFDTAVGRNLCLHLEKTNRPEEIRNYYNWRSHCCQKRYADDVPKLKEKLKFLKDDYATLPGDIMTISASQSLTMADSQNSKKPPVKVGPEEMLPKPKKKNLSKCKPRSVSSSPALRNIYSEATWPRLCTSSSTKEFTSPYLKSSSNIAPVTKVKKLKRLSKKENLTGNEDEDYQKLMHFATASLFEYEPPSWELSNLLRISAVRIPSDEELKNTRNPSKLKSRFTMTNKSLEQVQIPASK